MGKRDGELVVGARVVALVGHRSCGKTSLGELVLHAGGAVRTLGCVDEGSSLLDHQAEARERHASMALGCAWLASGEEHVHLVDTPGADLYVYERDLALSAADAALVVVDGGAGVELGTEQAIARARAFELGLLLCISKAERAQEGLSEDLAASLPTGTRLVALDVPDVVDGKLVGLVSLLDRTRCEPEGATLSAALAERVASAWELLMDAAASQDDALLEQLLEQGVLSEEQVWHGLRLGVMRGKLVPLVHASHHAGLGGKGLLDLLARAVSARDAYAYEADGSAWRVLHDGPLVAQLVCSQRDEAGATMHVLRVFGGEAKPTGSWLHVQGGQAVKVRKLYAIRGPRRKTVDYAGPGSLIATWDALEGRPGDTFSEGLELALPVPSAPPAMAWRRVVPASRRDAERLDAALKALLQRDPALALLVDVTGEALLAAPSDAHLDRAAVRLRREEGVEVALELPYVPYLEAPARPRHHVCGEHRVETSSGDVVAFGQCVLDMDPTADPLTESFAYRDEFPDQEELPGRFRPAIEQGAREALGCGPSGGYPVVGASVRLVGGAYDILESTEAHFAAAALDGVRKALSLAGTRLLEPWWRVDVWVPQSEVGAVISEVSSHRGQVIGLEGTGAQLRVCAHMPFRELRTWSRRLAAATAGRGYFLGDHSHYEPLPEHLASEAVSDSPFMAERACYERLSDAEPG